MEGPAWKGDKRFFGSWFYKSTNFT